MKMENLNQQSRNLPQSKLRDVKLKNKQSKSILSESSNSVSKSKSLESKKKINTGNLDSKTKQNNEVRKIMLIKAKLENVLKEKFTWFELIADENSIKIFEDLDHLDNNDIRIDYLWMTQISKSLHKFERYLKQKYK